MARSRKYGSRLKRTRKYLRKVYKKIAQKSRKMLKKTRSRRHHRRHHRGGASDEISELTKIEDKTDEIKNVMPEEGAALNHFFGNIGINKPSTPDETLFAQ